MRALILFLLLGAAAPAFAQSEGWAFWTIRKTYWTDEDEAAYSAFVAAIGRTKCNTFDACIRSPANPYRRTDSPAYKFFSDCADLPYMLRGYFAWKNHLPFSVSVRVRSLTPGAKDVRYSSGGNIPSLRMDIISLPGSRYPVAYPTLRTTVDNVHSGMYRIPPDLRDETRDFNGFPLSRWAPDFYSVAITRESIRPGTVIYDPNGHVAVVYAVENDGRVLYMDSHPDNSLTRGVYGKKFARSSPGSGAGFKNFRPQVLIGAGRDAAGNLIGGEIWSVPDSSLRDHDTTQFYGTKRGKTWSKGKFVLNGRELDYYDWVRFRLSRGGLKYHPVQELRNMMQAICVDIKDRVHAVQKAADDGFHRRAQPDRLPENIFGASGDWETYATPSRDARLKSAFVELRTSVQSMIERHRRRDSTIDYKGRDLKGDLLKAYDEESRACSTSYRRSNGIAAKLTFEDVRRRLFAMSFDPYHCPERRWGATTAAELSSCGDDSEKRAWYKAEQRLRNQTERAYDVPMGFTRRELENEIRGSGVDRAPETDTRAMIEKS